MCIILIYFVCAVTQRYEVNSCNFNNCAITTRSCMHPNDCFDFERSIGIKAN